MRVFTMDDGWVWTFAAVDHWCKVGSRFAALEPIAQGLERTCHPTHSAFRLYGSVEADVARGLTLRMDPRQPVPVGPLGGGRNLDDAVASWPDAGSLQIHAHQWSR